MSRAINLNATQEHVIAACQKRKLPISAIEALPSGGTRVVMNSGTDTAILAKLYGKKVLAGEVRRTPTRLARSWR